mgnify:CR=1 FL=1
MVLLRAPSRSKGPLLKWQPPSDCKLWLPGQDDPQSATLRDRSGQGNHGTITGAVWTRLSSGLWVLDFDGTDDRVTLSALNLSATDFTLLLWMKPTAAAIAAEKAVISMFSATTGWWWRFWAGNSGLLFTSYDAGGNFTSSTAGAIPAATWSHVAFVRVGALGTSYLNGADVTSGNTVKNPMAYSGTDPFYIGCDYTPASFYGGLQALVQIVSSAFSATQVNSRYQQERHLFGV